MKICPVCQSTYSDDTLRFCLQDGATLAPVAAASNPVASGSPGNSSRAGLIIAVVASLVLSVSAILLLLWMFARSGTELSPANRNLNENGDANRVSAPSSPPTAGGGKTATPGQTAPNANQSAPNLNPNVPRYEKALATLEDARRFSEFILKNKGRIVYLDIQATNSIATGDTTGAEPFLGLSEDCPLQPNKNEPARRAFCTGTDYVIKKTGGADLMFAVTRETYKLTGYFAVLAVDGPFQGRINVAMKPINVEDVDQNNGS